MLKKIAEKLQSITKEPVAVDPACFGDPVAISTAWTPAKSGGTNFRTHKLVEVNPDRLEFQASPGAGAFYLLCLLIGLVVMIGIPAAEFKEGTFSFKVETIMPVGIGLVFAIVGAGLLYSGTAPVVFDRRMGFFWKGRNPPGIRLDNRDIKNCAELKDIHALQLVSEYCRGSKTSYYSYELNLVLADGRRLNVVDHGDKNRLREDAGTVASFLKKPVWDAI